MALRVHRSAALQLDACVLPLAEWSFDDGHQLIHFIPGTWCKPKPFWDKRMLAAVSCPHCHSIRFLARGVHEVRPDGRVVPDLQCLGTAGSATCSFHRIVYLDRWNKKPLYACAIEVPDSRMRVWLPEMRYVSADSPEEARLHLGTLPAGTRIVAIAQAIGFFVQDGKDDTRLVADAKQAKVDQAEIRSVGGLDKPDGTNEEECGAV